MTEDVKELQKSIKKANQRIVEIGKKYGTNSSVYKGVTNQWLSGSYKDMVHISKSGNVAISYKAAKKVLSGTTMQDDYNRFIFKGLLTKVPTTTQLEKRVFKEMGLDYSDYKKSLSKKQLQEKVEEFYEISNELNDLLSRFYELYTTGDRMIICPDLFTSGKKTYSQLSKIVNKIKYAIKYVRYWNPRTKTWDIPDNTDLNPLGD